MKIKKNKGLIIIGVFIILIVAIVSTYFYMLKPVTKKYEEVEITINKKDTKVDIVESLKNANLIRNKYATLVYILLNGNKNIQAGSYLLTRNMSTAEIIEMLNKGQIIEEKKPSAKITFIEGITVKKYLELLAADTNLNYDLMLKQINDEDFLKSLIKDYWFLTDDILDGKIYYGLEGYLYPNTYEFYTDTTLENAIRKMLNETKKRLDPLKNDIDKTGLSVHEILTMASIIEKEANNELDRRTVSQVIHTRLDKNMSLGMDVTTYYGVQKEFKDKNGKEVKLTNKDLNDNNPYNTRVTTFIGLPIGPICNPSIISIKAALNPTNTNYIYFYAERATGKVHFTADYNEFLKFKKIYG